MNLKIKMGLIAFLSSVVFVVFTMAIPTIAYAGTSGDFFTGMAKYNMSSTPTGVEAWITPDNLQVYDVFSCPWVMIANSSHQVYAQVGWFKSPGMSEPDIYTEWNDGSGVPYHRALYGGYESQTHLYRLQDSSGYIYFYYGVGPTF